MKKLLGILSAVVIVGTGTSTVVSCDNNKITNVSLTNFDFTSLQNEVFLSNQYTVKQASDAVLYHADILLANKLSISLDDTTGMTKLASQLEMKAVYGADGKAISQLDTKVQTVDHLQFVVDAKAGATQLSGTSKNIDLYTTFDLANASQQIFTLTGDNKKTVKAAVASLTKSFITGDASLNTMLKAADGKLNTDALKGQLQFKAKSGVGSLATDPWVPATDDILSSDTANTYEWSVVFYPADNYGFLQHQTINYAVTLN